MIRGPAGLIVRLLETEAGSVLAIGLKSALPPTAPYSLFEVQVMQKLQGLLGTGLMLIM